MAHRVEISEMVVRPGTTVAEIRFHISSNGREMMRGTLDVQATGTFENAERQFWHMLRTAASDVVEDCDRRLNLMPEG